MVTGNNGVGNFAESRNTSMFLLADDHVGDENVGDAGKGKDFRFGNLRAGDADGTRFDFLPGNGGRFMTFDVRSPLLPSLGHVGRHLIDVRLHDVEIDAKGGSIEIKLI